MEPQEATTGAEALAAAAPAVETNWRESLSDEYRSDPALQDFKDVDSLAKAFKDTKSMVGGMLRVPGEDASAEDVSAFRQKLLEKNLGLMPKPDVTDAEALDMVYQMLGRPEDATGYEQIDGMSEARFSQIAQLAHKAGVNNTQLKTVLGELATADTEVQQQSAAEREQGIAELRQEWGAAFDQKQIRAANVAKLTKAPEELINVIESGGVNAATLRWLDGLAASLGSEGSELAEQVGGITQETRGELTAKRDELTRKIINDNLSPAEHDRLLQKLVQYNEQLAQ